MIRYEQGEHMNRRRTRAAVRRLSIVSLIVGVALGVGPVAAHADGWRTVTEYADNESPALAEAAVRTQVNNDFYTQATNAGQACTNVTVSASLYFIGGNGYTYVFQGTATGYCAVTPSYTVHRTAVRQYGSASQSLADSTSRQLVRSDLQAVGGNCTNVVIWPRWVSVSPARDWYVYEATADGLCSN
jgi:hypothetical protein